MPKLILNATRKGKTPFGHIMRSGIAPGYAIKRQIVEGELEPGKTVVVLLDKRNKKRAEGVLSKTIYTGDKTPQEIRRYDVHIRDLSEVPYRDEKVNHFGVGYIKD